MTDPIENLARTAQSADRAIRRLASAMLKADPEMAAHLRAVEALRSR